MIGIMFEVFNLPLYMCLKCLVKYIKYVCMFNVLTSELRVCSRRCDSTFFLGIGGSLQKSTTEKQQLAFAYQDLQKLYGALQRENEALKGQQRVVATGPEVRPHTVRGTFLMCSLFHSAML